MRRDARLLVGTAILAALAIGVTGLLAPVTEAAKPGGGQFCGGIAGIPCPEGFVCKDVPGDGCDPLHGGADCPGRCKRQPH